MNSNNIIIELLENEIGELNIGIANYGQQDKEGIDGRLAALLEVEYFLSLQLRNVRTRRLAYHRELVITTHPPITHHPITLSPYVNR